MMKISRRIIIFSIFLIILLGLSIFKLKNANNPLHYHAGFLVYVDGVLQDFSDNKYMDPEICHLVKQTQSPEEIQTEKAHIHDNIGDVVHVHQKGAVWNDLFKNINYKLPDSKPIMGYINNQLVNNILEYPIKPYDSVIIIVGDKTKVDLNKYVTKNQIKQVEAKSETCAN